jgi:hypothetical protein
MRTRTEITHNRRRRLTLTASTALALLLAGGCEDLIVDGRGISVEGEGTVEGVVRLDMDGNGVIGGQDPPVPGIRMRLLAAGSGGVVDTASTNEEGLYRMTEVPVGDFRLVIDSTALDEDVQVFGLEPEPFFVGPQATVQASFGLTFPEVSLAEARALDDGRTVFTRGIVLNQRPTPGDGVVHVREGDTYLRITNVPSMNLTVGDSVRILGRTATSADQPILEEATIIRLRLSDFTVIPLEITSAQARTAQEGSLDAALVRIRQAVILDTVSVGNHLRVTADDGSGPVDLFLREFINFNRTQLVPNEALFVQATGLLVPEQDGTGAVRWRLTPRAPGDLSVAPVPPPPPPTAALQQAP